MKFTILFVLVVLCTLASIEAVSYFGAPCTHTGNKAADDAACVQSNNNMLCNESNTCQCLDKYDSDYSGPAYKLSDDKESCIVAN